MSFSSPTQAIPRESMDYDVVIIGAGPAGLAAAIRLKQAAQASGSEVSVCVLEKGSEVGAHTLSGAVFDPRALNELLPDWQVQGAPLTTRVSEDRFLFLTESAAYQTPAWLLPPSFKNSGNYIISLGNLTRWLGEQAQALGVEIFPGFAATEILYDQDHAVQGVATGDLGVTREGVPGPQFQRGMALHAKYTLFAEGARGHLGRQLIQRFALDAASDPQVYGLGIKELWEVESGRHQPGLVIHSAGWPLSSDVYGGSFLYHGSDRQVAVGLVVGLGYSNPYLSPFEEFQRYKTHPAIRAFLTGGRRIAYGARAITAGGLVSLPHLVFPGGALLGCEAGFLNASRIKGSHAAIKSGMLAANAVFAALEAGRQRDTLQSYPAAFHESWLHTELHQARNFKQWMSKGLWTGALMVGIEQTVLRGHIPWTLHHRGADHEALQAASECQPIVYPKPDGVLTFDRLASVFVSNTHHQDNQPVHLTLQDANVPVQINLQRYDGPEARYCPAGVYEFIADETGQTRLQINAQNCVHCKTCDIKDPTQNIVWVAPEGGGGPNYGGM